MRKKLKPEQVFLDRSRSLITKLLIKNKNYESNYYWPEGRGDVGKLIEDTKERANYILEEIDKTAHLVLEK